MSDYNILHIPTGLVATLYYDLPHTMADILKERQDDKVLSCIDIDCPAIANYYGPFKCKQCPWMFQFHSSEYVITND